MDEIWKIAITLAGLGAVASFVLWSLYKQWLSLPIFRTLSQRNQFRLFVLFLVLTFFFALAALGSYTYLQVIGRSPQPGLITGPSSAVDALLDIHPEFARAYVHSLLGEPQLVESGCDGVQHEAFMFDKAAALLTFSQDDRLTAISVLVRDETWRPKPDWLQECLSCASFAAVEGFEPDFFNSSSKEWFYSESRAGTGYGNNKMYYLYYNGLGSDTPFRILPGHDIHFALEAGRPFPPWFDEMRAGSHPNGFAEVSGEASECGSLIYIDYVLIMKLV